MLDYKHILVASGVNPEKWARRFGLEPFTCPCQGCGSPRTTSVPFATKTLRGLVAPACKCGEKFNPYCAQAAPGTPDLLTQLRG